MGGAVDDRGPDEVLTFRRFPELPGVELLRGRRCRRLLTVFHETYAVGLLRRGSADYAYRGRLLRAAPGDLSAMEPGETHVTRRISGPLTFDVVFVDSAAVSTLAVELGMSTPRPHLRLFQLRHPPLFRSFDGVVRALDEGATPLQQETRLLAGLRKLLDTCGEEAPRERTGTAELLALRRARSILIDRAAEAVTLTELARETGLTRWHLVREFRRHVGLPPHRFQLAVRLTRARDLLARGATVAETASALGFSDQSHFHRHFRRSYGMTPCDYYRRLQNAVPEGC